METTFERFAGRGAILSGLSGFLYSLSFIVLQNELLSALFLMLGGLFSIPALTAVYQRLRRTESGFALLGFLFSLSAALGSAIHGGYNLANAIQPPAADIAGLPSAIDPRGLLTFGMGGLGLFVLSWLMAQGMGFPRRLAYLGYLSAVLMIILYLGRLIILQVTSPAIVIPALLEGFIVNPLWYVWLGLTFFRSQNQ